MSGGASKFFLGRRRKALDLCLLVAAQASFYGIKKTRTHPANHREMSHCSKKILFSRNELGETENTGATDLDELIANFLLQVREFLFLICVKKTISMKILVLRVINSHVIELLCTGLYSLVVCVKSPHSLVPRSFGL